MSAENSTQRAHKTDGRWVALGIAIPIITAIAIAAGFEGRDPNTAAQAVHWAVAGLLIVAGPATYLVATAAATIAQYPSTDLKPRNIRTVRRNFLCATLGATAPGAGLALKTNLHLLTEAGLAVLITASLIGMAAATIYIMESDEREKTHTDRRWLKTLQNTVLLTSAAATAGIAVTFISALNSA